MYLKSLEVHGFKSFANKLIFEFHDGITAIVGPNGSGKSNVADAVRWVLGEQSAKQLRGAKMEDVIFAGTQMRKPLGFAYVAITISNEDHKLNVPYEEVKIARRVYRSGESEYLLNGTACRLKDVQELLFDTGIGKEGYSIIGQGQIDKILSGKPEERRELFDEAAGIVKYKRRKASAQKNLEEEKHNLERIEDILSEIEKQVEPLEKQAAKAKQYLAFRDELRVQDVNMFLIEYDRIHEEIKEFEGKQAIADNDLKNANQEYEKSKREYERVQSELDEKIKSIELKKDRLNQSRVMLNNCEGDIRLLNEQINGIRQSENHYREAIESYKERIKNFEDEHKQYAVQKEENSKKTEEIKSLTKENEKLIANKKETAFEIENDIKSVQDMKLAGINAAADIKSEELKYKTLLEQNNIKRAELNKRVLANKSEASVLTETISSHKKVYDEITEKIKAIDDSNAVMQEKFNGINEENQNRRREHSDTQQKFHMENSRLNSLKNMTERYEGFGQSIKRVMERKEDTPGIIGVVADIIRVKKEYEIAVETALGGSIQNIVTDNEQTAKKMIEYLKKNRYGRATFLPLTNIHKKAANNARNVMAEKGVIGMASELVSADEKYNDLVNYLLGRFVVVDNIDNAIALAAKYHHTLRIVTTEGELLNPGGSMSGGAFKNNNNLLGRRRQIKQLEEDVEKFKTKLTEYAAQIEQGEKEIKELREKIGANNRLRQELIVKQNTEKIGYERAVSDLKKSEEQLELIRIEGMRIEEDKDKLKGVMDGIGRRISESEDETKDFDEKISRYKEKLDKVREELNLLEQKDSEFTLKITSLAQSEGFINENMLRASEGKDTVSKQLAQTIEDSRNIGGQIKQKQDEIIKTRNIIKTTKEEIENSELEIKKQNLEKEELSEKNKTFLDKREELSKNINELEMESFRLAGRKEKLTESIDNYTNYMWEQYELTYHSALALKTQTELTVSGMKAKIAEIKKQIKSLGSVNVNAIEQYKEVSERYELLTTQHDDLIEAAKVLEEIIENLDNDMRKQFEEQFAEIRSRFDKVFKELFGGGRGTLELMEDEDILTAGIKIIAQPPGKKLQNMMQLSGGEKALTAIALLFAIQSLKPSPFCLLDEIEAALDDSNVDRYAEYLHKLTKDTQFIIITHRRGTMNAADILYGITMQEKGVSTLVSVNLLDEKEIAN
ncbi:MAG: chromosome segregation protein SMC [Clostridium sp. CAG:12237_41]|nr:MAG: chromosome segregation protein SMC [Clostridium sp. CAG:12237_41]